MVTNNEQMVDVTPEPEVQAEQPTQEPVAETTEQPIAEPTTQSTEQPVVTEEQPQSTQLGSSVQDELASMREVINRQNQEQAHYQQLEEKQQAEQEQQRLQQESVQYQQQLENQGFLPEQAQAATRDYVSQQQKITQERTQLQQQQQFREGQRNAAVHFAKKYNLGIDEMSHIERHSDPQSMENEAKRIKELKDTKDELAKLKQQQVPVQQFDTNQPAASASGSEDELLEQYINGVSNPQTEAAGRRAAHGY
jgi:hypothetical protein